MTLTRCGPRGRQHAAGCLGRWREGGPPAAAPRARAVPQEARLWEGDGGTTGRMVRESHSDQLGWYVSARGIQARRWIDDVGVHVPDDRGAFTLHNPEITWRSEATFTLWDDCMSFPDLLVKVRRAESISIKYIDDDGRVAVLEKYVEPAASVPAPHWRADHAPVGYAIIKGGSIT